MLITEGKNRFELHLLSQESAEDAGLHWLNTEILVQQGQERFRQSGPWLTIDECRQLIKFFKDARQSTSHMRLSFIEPNVSFTYDAKPKQLTVHLDQEAKPPWLATGFLSFTCSTDDCEQFSNQLESALMTVLSRRESRRGPA